jgi:hypothetical protein
MTTLLRYQKRAGRFGREIRSEDSELDAAIERSELAGYVVDADAVAAAIVERLLAGGALRPPN